MKKLSIELRQQIECRVHIRFGQDVERHKDVTLAKLVCDTWNVESKLEHQHRYCCKDYLVLVVDTTLNLFDAEGFIKALNFDADIYYENGSFKAIYDNTYC